MDDDPYIWLLGAGIWCVFGFGQGMHGRNLLDFIQIILAVCGIVSWKKQKELIKPKV